MSSYIETNDLPGITKYIPVKDSDPDDSSFGFQIDDQLPHVEVEHIFGHISIYGNLKASGIDPLISLLKNIQSSERRGTVPDYKFREDELISELSDYIDSTYDSHYSTGRLQSTEVIIDRGDGKGFTHGNIDKYNARYGKKDGYNRKDILKVLHYGLLALYVHDLEIEGIDE